MGKRWHPRHGGLARQRRDLRGNCQYKHQKSNDPRLQRTFGVDHSHQVIRATHTTRAGGMVNGIRALHHSLQDLLVCRDVGSGEGLTSNQDRLHCFGRPDFTSAFEACNGHFLIARICEPRRVDNRMDTGVGGFDGDVATREWRYQYAGDGAVGFAIRGIEEVVVEETCVGVLNKEFNVGPVRAKGLVKDGACRIREAAMGNLFKS